MPRKKTMTSKKTAKGKVKLLLLQNYFVGGKFKKTGTVIEMPEALAAERLKKTDKIFRRV